MKINKGKKTMEKITLKFVDNQSHGYIQISQYDLASWNIDIKQFSSYSFYNQNNGCYYLEEDCDGSRLNTILKSKGYQINYKTNNVPLNYMQDPIFERINNKQTKGN